MTTIVTRVSNGAPLSNAQMDANLTNLNNDKVEVAAVGTAASKNTGTATGTVPLWESILLNGRNPQGVAYAVLVGDRGKLIDATTGTWALTMNPGTLGANFAFAVRNSGTGVITLTPSTGTIDGAATASLIAGGSCLIFCDGTNFETVGRDALPAATASVNGYMSSTYAAKLDGIAAGATVGIPQDVGVNGVGEIALMWITVNGTTVAANGTVAGSSLSYAVLDTSTMTWTTSGAATGTWKNITNGTLNRTAGAVGISVGTFQRIA